MNFFAQASETGGEPVVTTSSKAEQATEARISLGVGATIPLAPYRFSKVYFAMTVGTSNLDREKAMWALYLYLRGRVLWAISQATGKPTPPPLPKFEYKHEDTRRGSQAEITIERDETWQPKPYASIRLHLGYRCSVREVSEKEYQEMISWVDSKINDLALQVQQDIVL